MSQKILTTCDRCGTEFAGTPALDLRVYGKADASGTYDLCEGCLKALVTWIKEGLGL